MPRQICSSYPKISVLELQDSSGLTSIISWGALWDPWRPLGLDSPSEPSPSARLQYLWGTSCPDFVFSRYPEFAHDHDSGSRWFSTWENSHEATIKITCWAKLRKMIIGITIHLKFAFEWASRIDLTLHLSQHNGSWKLYRSWYSCFLWCLYAASLESPADVPSLILRAALSAIPFVSEQCGVDEQWFQERSSQALPNSKEFSV